MGDEGGWKMPAFTVSTLVLLSYYTYVQSVGPLYKLCKHILHKYTNIRHVGTYSIDTVRAV